MVLVLVLLQRALLPPQPLLLLVVLVAAAAVVAVKNSFRFLFQYITPIYYIVVSIVFFFRYPYVSPRVRVAGTAMCSS